MFIVVNFGYRQNRVYNINCQVGPLLDLVRRQSYADIQQYFTQKQRAFNKDLTEIAKRLEETKARLHVLEHPPLEEEKKTEPQRKKGRGRLGSETVDPEPVPEEVKPSEPDPKTVKPVAPVAKPKGGKKAETVVVEELSPEEIQRRKLEEEKEALKAQLASDHDLTTKYNEKLAKMAQMKEEFTVPLLEVDLADRGGERKYMGTKLEEQADTILAAKGTYLLVRRKNVESEEFENYTYDGYCVRTPDEDLTFVEEVVETKKGAAKKKK